MDIPEDFPELPPLELEAMPEVDPIIFEEDGMPKLVEGLTSQASLFVSARNTLDKYNPDGTRKLGKPGGPIGELLAKHLEETGSDIKLNFPAGSMTVAEVSMPGEPVEPEVHLLEDILAEEYDEAIASADNSSMQLVALVQAYREHVKNQIDGLVEDFRLEDKSWEYAWLKVQEIVGAMEGTYLAEVVDFFDGLVRLKYADTYDPKKYTRGKEVFRDPSAASFYKVMEPHLGTTNLTRDAWS